MPRHQPTDGYTSIGQDYPLVDRPMPFGYNLKNLSVLTKELEAKKIG